MSADRIRSRSRFVVWLLLLGVAFLLGRRFGEEPPPQAECPEPPVYVPAPEIVLPAPPRSKGRPVVARRLPAEEPNDQPHREALLAWVRSQAPAWSRCVPRGTQPIDAAVTMEVNKDGQIKEVSISADGALEPVQLDCLKRDIGAMSLPAELCRGEQRLLFGLRM